MNITEFLEARLVEEENDIRNIVNPYPWESAEPWDAVGVHLTRWSPQRALREIAAKRLIMDVNPAYPDPSEGLTEFEMHKNTVHPAYEYATTETARKAGDSRMPAGKGWEPNDIVECGWEQDEDGRYLTDKPIKWRNWERLEFTEEEFWRRLRPEGPRPLAGFIPQELEALASIYFDHPDYRQEWR